MKFRFRAIPPILVTIFVVSFASIFKYWMRQEVAIQAPFLVFFSAVVVSALVGGFTQGLIAISLSLTVVDWLFITPGRFGLFTNSDDSIRVALFLMDGLFVSLIGGVIRAARAKTEKALQEARLSEKRAKENDFRFRRVSKSNMMGLLITKRDGRIIEANDYFLQTVGYTGEDLSQGKLSWMDLTAPEHRELSQIAIRDMINGQNGVPYEKDYIHKDGHRVPVLIASASLDHETAVTFILDMTSRKQMEQQLATASRELEVRIDERTLALQQSEHFLDSVFENIPNMVFVKDAETLKFVRLNRAGEELLGLKREMMIGKSDHDFFPSDQAEKFVDIDREVLADRRVVDVPQETVKTKTGIRYLHTKKIPVFDKHGKPRYLLGISEDITEIKALERDKMRLLQEQAVRRGAEENAKRLELLAAAGTALNMSLDLKQFLDSFAQVIINKKFADLCVVDLLTEDGVDFRAPVIAHTDPKIVSFIQAYRKKDPIDWSRPAGIAHVARSGESEFLPEFPLERIHAEAPDAEDLERLLELGVSSVITVPMKLYGHTSGTITFVSTDPTFLFDTEDLAIAEELAKRAAVAVENARLYASAENANRAKSAFLANMSHEIRTPLGAMLGFAELVSEGDLSAEQRTGISTIVRNGKQLLRIVDEILDLSKVESERIQIEEMNFDLHALIQEVMTLLAGQAREKGLELSADIRSELPATVRTDPTRLRQILINVIGNAIKFTSQGSVRVKMDVRPATADEVRHLEVSIVDTGIGVSREQASKLFQPFAQADDSTTRRFGGTGLGLFLSRRLARLLGGDLVLEWSEPGKGSQFLLAVELHAATERASLKVSEKPALATDVPVGRIAERILIVDDAPDNRALIGRYVSKSGFTIDTAENGKLGVEKAMAEHFDLILMDIQMPEMDGFEAVRILREKNHREPIIALTAHAMKGDRELCLAAGFSEYLSKPIDKDRLLKTIRDQLAIRSH